MFRPYAVGNRHHKRHARQAKRQAERQAERQAVWDCLEYVVYTCVWVHTVHVKQI